MYYPPVFVHFWIRLTSSIGKVGRMASSGSCAAVNAATIPSGRSHLPKLPWRHARTDGVSGRGHVVTFTVNLHPWIPNAHPYIIAIVELNEQAGLFLTSNLVGIDGDDVEIGMAVQVVFEESEGIWFPLFRPLGRVSA